MDYLDKMLKLQGEFQAKFAFHPPLHRVASAIMTEAGELWEASEGKWWTRKKHTDEERREELVDILHFFLSYCVEMGISPRELFGLYARKLAVNYQRQFEEY